MHIQQIEIYFQPLRVSRQVSGAAHNAVSLGAGGELTCKVACKPLLSMCSKVICQLSCSSRQSFKAIAHILLHPRSFFGQSWAWPLTLCLLSLLPPALSQSLLAFSSISFFPLKFKCCFPPLLIFTSLSDIFTIYQISKRIAVIF